MSENTQNNHPAERGEKKEGQNGERGQRNHRHRRPHHKGNRPQNADQVPQESSAAPVTERPEGGSEQAKKQHNHNRGQGNRHGRDRNQNQNQNQNQGQSKNRNQSRDQNRGRGQNGGRGGRHGQEKRPFDPYEQPSRQEIELSELRAQIVLKAADGSVPTAYSTSPAPAGSAAPSASAVTSPSVAESVSLPSDAEATDAADLPAIEPDELLTPAPDNPEEAPEDLPRVEVVGVRFRASGKTYYFDPRGIRAKKGDFAIVETTRGPEFGEVGLANTMVNANSVVSPLRPLLRIATKEDIAHNAENRERERQALKTCQEKIAAHKLDMKLIDVQYAFDNSKLLFYFAAEGRVDFRELVKDLASVFRTRIELRQIGIRDEAKMLGGIGACGRALCCSTFLPDFAQVSIKMAKDQNLSLNTSKISGVCGRLMCCLRYESEVYAEEIRKTPAHDATVRTPDGVGTVIGSNPLAGTVRVLLKDTPDTPPKQYHRDEVTVLPKERRGGQDHARAERSGKNETPESAEKPSDGNGKS